MFDMYFPMYKKVSLEKPKILVRRTDFLTWLYKGCKSISPDSVEDFH